VQVVHDETGRVWIMLHSGSRNVGKTTAEHYDGIAAKWLAKAGVGSTKEGLNYMPIDSAEGRAYLGVSLQNQRTS